MVERGRCPEHAKAQRQHYDERRGSANDRLYGYRWQQASKAFLHAHPLCHYCAILHRIEPSTCVDHATPHKGDPHLFWDKSNWRASCKHHNDAKGDRDEPTYLRSLGVIPKGHA